MKDSVFISYAEEDTVYFVSYLCDCLRMKQIKTERDKLLTALKYLNAIEVPRISVIVFSENFGGSLWCLDEVIALMKCKERFGQIVIPVFYNVDPLDIRNQTGRFGDVLRSLPAVVIQQSKDYLTQASKIQGLFSTAIIRDEEMLVNEIVRDIQNKLPSLRASRTKGKIERSLVITNLMLEIPSCVLDQMSSTHRPRYTLAAMLLSLLALLVNLTDLVHKGRCQRVVWKTRPIPWFYYGFRRSKKFGSFADMVGLLCGLCQTIASAINFSFITRKVDAPIKVSVWPIIFALGVLFTMCVKQKQN